MCSVANNISLLLVGRCLQGVGGGGLVSLTYVIITDMVTLRERGKWMSIISAQWAVGSVLGPGSYSLLPLLKLARLTPSLNSHRRSLCREGYLEMDLLAQYSLLHNGCNRYPDLPSITYQGGLDMGKTTRVRLVRIFPLRCIGNKSSYSSHMGQYITTHGHSQY